MLALFSQDPLAMPYMKTPIPTEHLCEFLNQYLHRLLGNEGEIKFRELDVQGPLTLRELQEEDVLGFIIAYPTSKTYQDRLIADEDVAHAAAEEDADYGREDEGDDVLFFPQMLPYAPALYALLHIMANGKAAPFIGM